MRNFPAGFDAERIVRRNNLAELDYLDSRLLNAVNQRQSDIRVRTGIALRFGPR